MKVLFHIFGFPVHFFGLMIAIGMLSGIYIAYLESKRKGLNTGKLMDVIFYCILAGMVGARLFYVVFYDPAYYFQNPISIIMINQGGLSIHGGLAAAFITAIIYCKKQRLDFFRYADAVAPGIILGQGIGRVGCDVFGRTMTDTFMWGIKFQGQLVHPTQAYEFILNYLVFFILWRKRKKVKYDGQIFLMYVILFALNRGIVEFFRYNPSIWGWFSISHLLSLIFITISLGVMYRLKQRKALLKPEIETTSYMVTLIKDVLMIILLVGVSLLIYYTIQG